MVFDVEEQSLKSFDKEYLKSEHYFMRIFSYTEATWHLLKEERNTSLLYVI